MQEAGDVVDDEVVEVLVSPLEVGCVVMVGSCCPLPPGPGGIVGGGTGMGGIGPKGAHPNPPGKMIKGKIPPWLSVDVAVTVLFKSE